MPCENCELAVTDHAILRFLERTGQIDIDAVKRAIVSDRVAEQVRVLGDGKYPIGNGLMAVVKDCAVITILVIDPSCLPLDTLHL